MLNPELRQRLWPFLGGIAKQNGVKPRSIGGVADHVHRMRLTNSYQPHLPFRGGIC